MIKANVKGANAAAKEVQKFLEQFVTDHFVTVGIHEDENARGGDDMTNARLGAIQHFGANINHPGGTPYKIASNGLAIFVKKGDKSATGVTKAHNITIPARPWLDVGVEQGNKEYLQIINDGIKDGLSTDIILEQIGLVAQSTVQQYMTDLRTPPNKSSTVRKKGSSNPLIDTGELRQSVTYKIVQGKPTEGI